MISHAQRLAKMFLVIFSFASLFSRAVAWRCIFHPCKLKSCHAHSMDNPLDYGLNQDKKAPILTNRNIIGQGKISCREFSLDTHKTFSFVSSYHHLNEIPTFPIPEIALVGRSNVGKSSLINCLSGLNKPIALRSKQPGRTQSINLFKVSDKDGDLCMIADLPGYGFAKLSKERKRDISMFVDGYLQGRDSLMATLVLIDGRLDTQEADVDMISYLSDIGNPFAVIATKMDKVKTSEISRRVMAFQQALSLPSDQPIAFSATSGLGKRKVWHIIKDALLGRASFGDENFELVER